MKRSPSYQHTCSRPACPRHQVRALALALLALIGLTQHAVAASFVFDRIALPPPTTVIDFDEFALTPEGPVNLRGETVEGVTFRNPRGNSLDVVPLAFTTTGFASQGPPGDLDNTLVPTSGGLLLSPGGFLLTPGPALQQEDSLRLIFRQPVSAFGADVLFQSLDGNSFVTVRALNSEGQDIARRRIQIGTNNVQIDPTSSYFAAGSTFVGLLSDDPSDPQDLIKEIRFREFDRNAANPDANIGYDTLQYTISNPEPSTFVLVGTGLAGLWWARRRRPES